MVGIIFGFNGVWCAIGKIETQAYMINETKAYTHKHTHTLNKNNNEEKAEE